MAEVKPAGTGIFECVVPFTAVVDGNEVTVAAGELARAGHAVLEGREELFKPVELQLEVEQGRSGKGRKK